MRACTFWFAATTAVEEWRRPERAENREFPCENRQAFRPPIRAAIKASANDEGRCTSSGVQRPSSRKETPGSQARLTSFVSGETLPQYDESTQGLPMKIWCASMAAMQLMLQVAMVKMANSS